MNDDGADDSCGAWLVADDDESSAKFRLGLGEQQITFRLAVTAAHNATPVFSGACYACLASSLRRRRRHHRHNLARATDYISSRFWGWARGAIR